MFDWNNVLKHWGGPDFDDRFKRAVKAVDPRLLPLQAGLSQGSQALDTGIQAVMLRKEKTGDALKIKAGIFYKSIITGCGCADDPTPVDELNEYCEVEFEIDAASGEARVRLL